jgi:hypothetical protein
MKQLIHIEPLAFEGLIASALKKCENIQVSKSYP